MEKKSEKTRAGGSYNRLTDATIMIVDDEEFNRSILKSFLEEAKFQNIVIVEKSTEAMMMLEKTRPDLILLDIMMPEVSGFDILSSVRTHPKFKYLPVIILTSLTDTENKHRALEMGATDYLSKPLDDKELILRVRNTLAAKTYLDQLAYYDSLTKLPKRQLFLEDLEWALKRAKRHHEQLALLNIELDNFDKINDTIGLTAGDEVLSLVAQRIQSVIRSFDVLSRATEDENAEISLFHLDSGVFSLLLDRINSAQSGAVVAERIIREIRAPMQVEEREIYLTASIGVATYPLDSGESTSLLRLASSAKNFAKNVGGDSFQFASIEINEMYERRLRCETRLRRALENEELVLYYQPKVDVETGIIQGVEALVRMNSDDNFVSPDEFISLAEETGLIVPMGEWVLKEACRQLREWHQSDRSPVGMSINFSSKQFNSPEFLAVVRRIIDDSGIDSRFLTLEITESLLITDIDEKLNTLKQLKEMGLKLSIDDFGTGYSSLSYLRMLPVDELKIDRSFIKGLAEHADSRAIVSTIIFLADKLGLLTVAEGIESEEELNFLKKEGCHQYQGYFFSPPLRSDEVFKLFPAKA